MEIKYCKNCGKELSKDLANKNKIYCNQKCYFEWRSKNPAHNNQHVYVKCANCNQEFRIQPAKIKGSKTGNLFCCKKCKDEFYSQGYSDILCNYCGKPIHISNAKLKSKTNVYCNKDCKSKWESENWKNENNPNYKGGEFRKCKYCGEEYWVYNDRKETSVYCSKNCQTKDFQENISKTKEFSEEKRKSTIATRKFQKTKFTKPEVMVKDYLDKYNILNIPQHVMYDRFVVDFYLPKTNIVIEVLGDYWHGHPDKYGDGLKPLSEKQIKTKEKDKLKYNMLTENGHNVFMIWECDIYDDVSSCINKLNIKI